MPKSFIELVPRTAEELTKTISTISSGDFPCDGFNLPEIRGKKHSFLSPEAMMAMRRAGELAPGKEVALHMRTRDHSIEGTLQRIQTAAAANIQTALLITGDSIESNTLPATVHTQDFLNTLHSPPQDISLAIGADLYHQHWGRWSQKIPAMRRGLVQEVFTQPIFSEKILEDIQSKTKALCPREHIFAGITWVTDAKSRDYWHRVNAIPLDVLPQGKASDTIRANSIARATALLRLARKAFFSTYLMIMRGTLQELREIFEKAENIQEI